MHMLNGHSGRARERPYMDHELVVLYETILRLEGFGPWYMKCFFVRFALATGMRVFELRVVQVVHVLLAYENPVILIPSGKGPRRNGQNGRERSVTVIPEFSHRLRKHMAKQARVPEDYLFWCNTPKQPPAKLTLERWWQYVAWDMARLRHVPIHQGARGTYASEEARRLTIHVLADQLGNTPNVLQKHYRRPIMGDVYSDKPPAWREVAAR